MAMLGDLIYEGNIKIIGTRVLNAEENRIEHTNSSEGKFKDIDGSFLGTFWVIPVGKDVFYGEGQHVITTKDGRETATFRGYGIERLNTESKRSSFRGSVFFKASSNGRLAFLNNIVGAFETEANESGQGVVKIWEWK